MSNGVGEVVDRGDVRVEVVTWLRLLTTDGDKVCKARVCVARADIAGIVGRFGGVVLESCGGRIEAKAWGMFVGGDCWEESGGLRG